MLYNIPNRYFNIFTNIAILKIAIGIIPSPVHHIIFRYIVRLLTLLPLASLDLYNIYCLRYNLKSTFIGTINYFFLLFKIKL